MIMLIIPAVHNGLISQSSCSRPLDLRDSQRVPLGCRRVHLPLE
jgi:hypothetical protein